VLCLFPRCTGNTQPVFVPILQTPKCLPSDTSVKWVYAEPHDS
jgi:hypothetical protein